MPKYFKGVFHKSTPRRTRATAGADNIFAAEIWWKTDGLRIGVTFEIRGASLAVGRYPTHGSPGCGVRGGGGFFLEVRFAWSPSGHKEPQRS